MDQLHLFSALSEPKKPKYKPPAQYIKSVGSKPLEAPRAASKLSVWPDSSSVQTEFLPARKFVYGPNWDEVE